MCLLVSAASSEKEKAKDVEDDDDVETAEEEDKVRSEPFPGQMLFLQHYVSFSRSTRSSPSRFPSSTTVPPDMSTRSW